MQQPLANTRIIECLKTDYGINVSTLTFLPLGADMNSSVYKAEAQDQSSYFVKLKLGHTHDISITILELLHKHNIQQIIPPITTKYDQPTQRVDDFTLIVYPFVEGENGFSRTLTDEQWLMLGRALRQVHEIEVPILIQRQLRRENYSPKWREIVRSLYNQNSQINATPIGDEIALKLSAFMKINKASIQRLVDHAEELAQKIKNESPKFVLCHSDIHGGNVLIENNNTIYIVDWDEPIMAPKERDLMFIGGGVGNVWNKPSEVKLFYQGYGKTEINITMLAYYRHERIVEDIALYAQQLLFTLSGGEDRYEMYKHFISMFEPNGVVDIAFKTKC